MMIFYGLCGVLLGLGLTALGAAGGWMACRAWNARRVPPAKTTHDRNDRLAQEQAAFRQLQQYSVEQAYGLMGGRGEEAQ